MPALDCANYTVAMFSDLKNGYASKSLHDGGFSNMGESRSNGNV
jgi:hypothetical protein